MKRKKAAARKPGKAPARPRVKRTNTWEYLYANGARMRCQPCGGTRFQVVVEGDKANPITLFACVNCGWTNRVLHGAVKMDPKSHLRLPVDPNTGRAASVPPLVEVPPGAVKVEVVLTEELLAHVDTLQKLGAYGKTRAEAVIELVRAQVRAEMRPGGLIAPKPVSPI